MGGKIPLVKMSKSSTDKIEFKCFSHANSKEYINPKFLPPSPFSLLFMTLLLSSLCVRM